MTIKPHVIAGLLRSLQERHSQLKQLQSLSRNELTEDFVKWNAVLHLLQISVESITDICAHILTGIGADVPDNHRLIIQKMGEPGVNILPMEFAMRISAMASFRNIVVHNYMSVDPEQVVKILHHNLDDVLEFRTYVFDYLRREGHL
jgi:uncharacterized protein YutE (UPF0331/DUF86 family)